MRRTDREVTDFQEIVDMMYRAETLRLGLKGTTYPYIVPLSFGLELIDGVITLYIHGAKEGLKYDLIRQNPNVCVEMDIFHRYAEVQGSVTAEYESVIGFGKCELITGDVAAHGLDVLLTHCGYDGFEYNHKVLEITAVYRIRLESYTGKRRFL